MPYIDEPEFTPEQLEEMKKRIIAADPDGIFRGMLGSIFEQEVEQEVEQTLWKVNHFQVYSQRFYLRDEWGYWVTTAT